MTGYDVRLYVRDSDILNGRIPYTYFWELHNTMGVFSINGFNNPELKLGFTYPSERTIFTVTLTVTDDRHFSTTKTFVYYYGEFFELDNRILVQNPWGLYMTLAFGGYLQINWSNIVELTPENNLQINVYGSIDGIENYTLLGTIGQPSSVQAFITNVIPISNSIYRFKVSTYNTVTFEERFNTEGPVSYITEFSCTRDNSSTWIDIDTNTSPTSAQMNFSNFLAESTITRVDFSIYTITTGVEIYQNSINILEASTIDITNLLPSTGYLVKYEAYSLNVQGEYTLVSTCEDTVFYTSAPCESPIDLILTAGIGEITVNWTQAYYTHYSLYYKKASESEYIQKTYSSLPCTITGLDEEVEYDIKLHTECITFGGEAFIFDSIYTLRTLTVPTITSVVVDSDNCTNSVAPIIPVNPVQNKPTITSLQKVVGDFCSNPESIILEPLKVAPTILSFSLFSNPCS